MSLEQKKNFENFYASTKARKVKCRERAYDRISFLDKID